MTAIHLAILMPVYNDWESVTLLLAEIDRVFQGRDVRISVLLADDASTVPVPANLCPPECYQTIERVEVLHLRCNLGHQRAIAIGLVEFTRRSDIDCVIVMDADGEDRPEDAARLLDRYLETGASEIVVARRDRRSEGLLFTAFYHLYRRIFRLLTGAGVDFGNFCLIPVALLDRLVYRDTLWNHLSATILRSRLPLTALSTRRGTRLKGRSRMNFADLVLHGLSAISVWIDRAFLRTLLFSGGLFSLAVSGILTVAAIRFFTDLAIPGWASAVVGSLLIILILSLLLSIFVLFLVLANRSQLSMLPARHAGDYVQRIVTVYGR